jgi:hypothetical protein
MEAIKKKQRFASTRYFGKLFYFLYHNGHDMRVCVEQSIYCMSPSPSLSVCHLPLHFSLFVCCLFISPFSNVVVFL